MGPAPLPGAPPRDLYPPIDPHAHGWLDVGDGHAMYWEACGEPDGVPALMLHGGPGIGCVPRMRRAFDPARYRVILVDQRGCGRSRPLANDPTLDLDTCSTWHLVADLERLREHLGVDRWVVTGGSWGAALALAYAERHPDRVRALVLSAVMTARPAELAWLYRGVRRFFPAEWEAARSALGDDLIAGAVARLADPDPAVRLAAARAWCAWEDAVLSLERAAPVAAYAQPYGDDDADAVLTFARLCAWTWHRGAWLADGQLLRDAGRLAGIPGVIVHGRRDLSCPFDTAWDLARAWPDASLVGIHDAGHLATPAFRAALLDALDRFGR